MDITPLLAQAGPNPSIAWNVILTIGVLVAIGANVASLFKKPATTISPQPLTVEVVKALHEQFADRDEFNDLKQHTTERHGQLFKGIDRVEREMRAAMDKRFEALATDRQASLEKLNTQFTFIRENVVAIQTELKIRNRST